MNALRYLYKDELIPYRAIEAIYRNSFDIDGGTSLFGVEHIANLLNVYLTPQIDISICEVKKRFKQLLIRALNYGGITLLIRQFKTYHVLLAYKVLNNKATVFDSATKLKEQTYDIDKLLEKTALMVLFTKENI
jgi:hypothetical protein